MQAPEDFYSVSCYVVLGSVEVALTWRGALQAWLGLSYVDIPALWALFVAFGASIIQVALLTQPACLLLACVSFHT